MPQVKDSEIHNDYWGSDHCPISLTMDINSINVDEFREYMALNENDESTVAAKEETDAENGVGLLDEDHTITRNERDEINNKNVVNLDDLYNEEAKSDLEDFDEYQDQSMLAGGLGLEEDGLEFDKDDGVDFYN